ncbi:MAG: hypothetical protein ABIJ86_06980, partial [Spirochaetota bacterium]
KLRLSGFYHLAPEAWKQAHQLRTQSTKEAQAETMDSPEFPDAWSKLRRQSWAATTVVLIVTEGLYGTGYFLPNGVYSA